MAMSGIWTTAPGSVNRVYARHMNDASLGNEQSVSGSGDRIPVNSWMRIVQRCESTGA